MCVIATYYFSCCFFLIPLCHWICSLCHVVTGVLAVVLLPESESSLCTYCLIVRAVKFSLRKLLGAEKVNVIVHSAFKKLFEL